MSSSGAVPKIGMIWAQTPDGVIGNQGTMPWRVPEDMAHFKNVTTGHPVIMGRRTWESFPAKFRPLPDRTNIVLTSDLEWSTTPEAAGAVAVPTLEEALVVAAGTAGSEEVWIVGGGQVYAQALSSASLAVLTIIDLAVEGDTYAPKLGAEWTLSTAEPPAGWHESRAGARYRFEWWTR
ncbi:dihydrofolate reductase [Psychromicrobium silvestre]|uniref:Dihydrofolate reductase n=1 Tax=Psychromicrobium silvestre TaxID=1645614 RepID=A0A7Y9S729_9MICC|nr:dihydrofolate reductase [Psychromicrobium silvestre]NYE95330.1 dihydrofolate reductase [Psychromicrobium silvestre]